MLGLIYFFEVLVVQVVEFLALPPRMNLAKRISIDEQVFADSLLRVMNCVLLIASLTGENPISSHRDFPHRGFVVTTSLSEASIARALWPFPEIV